MEQRFTHRMDSEAAITSTHVNVGKSREEVHRSMNAVPELAPIIAGYMAKGEAFRNLEFRVESLRGRRIDRVRLELFGEAQTEKANVD